MGRANWEHQDRRFVHKKANELKTIHEAHNKLRSNWNVSERKRRRAGMYLGDTVRAMRTLSRTTTGHESYVVRAKTQDTGKVGRM